MVAKSKLSIDEKIALAKEKLKKLEEMKKSGTAVKLTKDSVGMKELLADIDAVATKNKVKVSAVLLAVAKIKRTGLKLVPSEKDTNSYLL